METHQGHSITIFGAELKPFTNNTHNNTRNLSKESNIYPPNKRPRNNQLDSVTQLDHQQDRITNLPENLIIDRILNLLPTKDAIRTSVLSKKWQNRWTMVNCLCFDLFENVEEVSNADYDCDFSFDGDESSSDDEEGNGDCGSNDDEEGNKDDSGSDDDDDEGIEDDCGSNNDFDEGNEDEESDEDNSGSYDDDDWEGNEDEESNEDDSEGNENDSEFNENEEGSGSYDDDEDGNEDEEGNKDDNGSSKSGKKGAENENVGVVEQQKYKNVQKLVDVEDLNPRFINFVTGALKLHQASTIKQFEVHCCYSYDQEAIVSEWVRFATSKDVKDLSILLSAKRCIHVAIDNESFPGELFMLPQHLYVNESIKTMELSCCKVSPQSIVNWSSVYCLNMSSSLISEDTIKEILMRCPGLLYLKLEDCKGFQVVDTRSSSSLKMLVIDGFSNGGPKILQIYASKDLVTLELQGNFSGTKCRLVNTPPSLECASLTFRGPQCGGGGDGWVDWQYMLLELLDKVRRVKFLKVEHWCIKVLSMSKIKNVSAPFSSCKCLVLESLLTFSEFHGVISLLESSERIEELLIRSGTISNVQLSSGPVVNHGATSYGDLLPSNNERLKRSL